MSLVLQNQSPATITTSATVPPTKPAANLNNLLRGAILVRGETDSCHEVQVEQFIDEMG